MTRLSGVLIVASLMALGAAGCDPTSVMVHRPETPSADAAVTAMWTREIHGVARDGDWILTRSYYAMGDAIAQLEYTHWPRALRTSPGSRRTRRDHRRCRSAAS